MVIIFKVVLSVEEGLSGSGVRLEALANRLVELPHRDRGRIEVEGFFFLISATPQGLESDDQFAHLLDRHGVASLNFGGGSDQGVPP